MTNNILDLLKTEEQKGQFRLIISLINHYLQTGYNGRIIIDLQKHRINDIQNIAFISGISQILFYQNKIS